MKHLSKNIKRFSEKIEFLFPKDSIVRMILQLFLISIPLLLISNGISTCSTKNLREKDEYILMLNQRKEFIDNFSNSLSERLYYMRVLFWELSLHNDTIDYRQIQVEKKYSDYYNALSKWNINLFTYYSLMNLYFPNSIHYLLSKPKYNILLNELENCEYYKKTKKTSDHLDNIRFIAEYVLQSGFEHYHNFLYKLKDKRLEKKDLLSEEEIKILKKEDEKMKSICYLFSELLYELHKTQSN